MKISQQKNKYKKIIIVLVVTALAATGALTYIYTVRGSLFEQTNKNISSEIPANLDEATSDQKKAGEDTKKNTAENTKPGSNNSDTPQDIKPAASGDKSTIDVMFSAVSQNDSTLQLRVLIPVIEPSGVCTLTMTKGSTTVVKTSETQAQSNSSTCKGFDIPTSELSAGSWKVIIEYTGDRTKGSATRAIGIE